MTHKLSLQSLGYLFVLSLLLLATPVRSQEADETVEHEERETLKAPIPIPHNGGVYRELHDLPEAIRKSKPFARDLHLLNTRVTNDTEVNYEQRIRAHAFAQSQQIDAARKLAKKPDASVLADAWTNIAPSATSSSSVLSGGMTASIAINPKRPQTMYAGAAGGGVWKSYTSGDNWFPLTDNVIPDLAVSSVALDPIDTNVLYVGTGNANSAIRGLGGSGVYKSTDGGASWARIGTNDLKGTIAKVYVHPKQNNIVFASGFDDTRGIFRSTNSGQTWTKVLSITGSGRVWDIAPAGIFNNTDVLLYAVLGNSNAAQGGVYKSTNNGSTWSKITNGGLPTGDQIGRAGLAISPKNTNKVWVLMAKNSDGDMLGLYRSTDGGQAFTKVTTAPNTLFKPTANIGAQGWYDLSIGVSQNSNSTDTVIIGGIEAWYTHNSGQNWTMFSGYSDLPSSAPHVDHHFVAFHPGSTQRVYVGTDGGIYLSTNGGKAWSAKVNGYVTHRYYRLGLQASDSKVTWLGAQDQGIWKHTTGSTTSFRGLGDGFQVAVNPQSSNEVIALGPNGEAFRSSTGGNIGSFVSVSSSFNDASDWDAPMKIGNKSPYTRWIGRQNLWKSSDGTSWSKTAGSPGFTASSPIRSLAINPYNNNTVWVGGYDKVKRSTNAGTDWEDKSTGVPSAVVTSIQLAGDQNFAVISIASQSTSTPRVMVSTNAGDNWTNASGTGTTALPAAICWSIALDSLFPKTTWYAATDFGMYITRDAGDTWSVAGSGIGLAPCWDVALHPNKATLRVATFGRGLWEANTNVLPVELSSLTATPRDAYTELKWTTDSERSSWRFYVRRSFNYGEFEEIGHRDAAGNSNTRKHYAFEDPMVDTGYYLYQLRMVDLDGSESYSNFVEVHRGDAYERISLDQNFPNPLFLDDEVSVTPTRFKFYLPKGDHVSLKIFNTAGQHIHTLVDQYFDAGQQDVFWNGRDTQGMTVSAGTYLYVLETSTGEQFWNKLIVIN